MTNPKWTGEADQFWNAVAIANDADADEMSSIAAALLLQEILVLAQDTFTKPSSSQTMRAAVPARVIAQPRPGEIVTDERAVELFGDRWILRPVEPSKESTLSGVRDYRVHDGQLEVNATGYPPTWKPSGGTITDCPHWQVICQQQPEVDGRASRTSVRSQHERAG